MLVQLTPSGPCLFDTIFGYLYKKKDYQSLGISRLYFGDGVQKYSRFTAKDFVYYGSASNHSFLSIEPFNYANSTLNCTLRKFDAT